MYKEFIFIIKLLKIYLSLLDFISDIVLFSGFVFVEIKTEFKMTAQPMSTKLEFVISCIAYSFFNQTSELLLLPIQNNLIRNFHLQLVFFYVTYFYVWLSNLELLLPIKINNLYSGLLNKALSTTIYFSIFSLSSF